MYRSGFRLSNINILAQHGMALNRNGQTYPPTGRRSVTYSSQRLCADIVCSWSTTRPVKSFCLRFILTNSYTQA